jgi:hypothetical protein
VQNHPRPSRLFVLVACRPNPALLEGIPGLTAAAQDVGVYNHPAVGSGGLFGEVGCAAASILAWGGQGIPGAVGTFSSPERCPGCQGLHALS